MRFDYIKLQNYRQYKDILIEFPDFNDQKNFVIIVGGTGAGKTNLLNAITWCLYEIEYNIRDKNKALPIINLPTFEEMKEGDFSEVSVEIQMRGENNERLVFQRKLIIKKKSGKPEPVVDYNSSAPGGSTFSFIRQIGRDMIPVSDPVYILNTLIPQSIEEYFFFDGERLNDYFKGDSKIKVKEAVYKISQIGLLERVINHLSDRRMDFTSKARKLSPKTQDIRTRLEWIQRSFEKEKEIRNRLKSQLEEAKKKFEEFSQKLRNSSNIDIKTLEAERLQLEENIKNIDEDLSQLKKEKIRFLTRSAPIIYLKGPLEDLANIIKERDESGKIPPEFRKDFVDRLLKDGECLCGTNLRTNLEAAENLKRIITEYDDVNELSNLLIRLQGQINLLQSKTKSFDGKRMEKIKIIRDIEEKRKKNSIRLKQIEELFKDIDTEKEMYWETQRQHWFNAIQDLNLKIGAKNRELEDFEKKILGLEKDLDEELNKDERNKELIRIRQFCRKAETTAKKVKDEIMSEIREEIEKKTNEQFLSLIWKTKDYEHVKIDEEYNVSVLHKSGFEGLGTLSAGEGIVLAMSFMTALNSESGFNVPIIIDTPLGRIAGIPRKKFAEKLPNYLPGKQVTMLVTDTEYTPDVKEILAERVGKTYKINFMETGTGGISEVIEVE